MEDIPSIEFRSTYQGKVHPKDMTFEVVLKDGTKSVPIPKDSILGLRLKPYLAWHSISIDLEQSVEDLEVMRGISFNNPDNERHLIVCKAALWKSAVVGYGKCFNKGAGRKSVMLDPGKIFKGLASASLLNHKAIIDERSNYQAHAGVSGHEASSVMALVVDDGQGQKKVAIGIQGARGTIPTADRVDDFLRMLSFVRAYVAENERAKMEGLDVKPEQLPGLLKTPSNGTPKGRR